MSSEAKKGQIKIIVFFILMILLDLAIMYYYQYIQEPDGRFIPRLVQLIMKIGIMVLVFLGKNWARVIFSILLAMGILVGIYSTYRSIGNVSQIFQVLALTSVYIYGFIILVFDKNFKAFMEAQKEKF